MSNPTLAPVSAFKRIGIAFIVALIYGLALYLLIWYDGDNSTLPFIGGLFLMPMAIASIATAIADPRGRKSRWSHVRNGWIVIAILVLISVLIFKEGGICVIMAAPCFLIGSAAGSLITLAILRRFHTTKPTSLVITLPLLLLPFEPYLAYSDYEGSVTSVIEINAPPSEVWANTVIIPDISPKELPFSFSHNIVGVPRPENADIAGHGTGAVRQLRWSQGVQFEEVITEWQPDQYLAWDFRFGPDSIPDRVEAHIDVDSRYLKLANGDYRIEALEGGRTRLTLTTRYTISTPINTYCALWGHIFLNDFHNAVLKVIKTRSEI